MCHCFEADLIQALITALQSKPLHTHSVGVTILGGRQMLYD